MAVIERLQYWYPMDFTDPTYRDMKEYQLPHGCFFDYFGATEPEDARLPRTYWTKKRILDYIDQSGAIKEDAKEIMLRMDLEDLHANALKYVGSELTGRVSTAGTFNRECRFTQFFGLDVGNINSFGGSA